MQKIILPSVLLMGILLQSKNLCAQELRVGDELSTFELEEYLQAPKQFYHYQDLKGQALVLVFWATWHASSIRSIPHLNNLTKQFETEPIQFISITYEDKSAVEYFLQRNTVEGWIGLDKNRSIHKMLGIYNIPRTVLISPSGKITAIVKTDEVNTKVLEKLINDGPIEIQSNKSPIYSDSSMINKYDGIYTSNSTSISDLIQIAYDYSPARIIAPDSILNSRLKISIQSTGTKKEDLKTHIQNTLKYSIGLNIKQEIRYTDVYILSAPNGIAKGLRTHSSPIIRTSTARGVIAASAAPIYGLVKQLEEILEVPVVNNTNLKATYDWALTFNHKNPTSLIDIVKVQLGLNLRLDRRDVEVLIVKSK